MTGPNDTQKRDWLHIVLLILPIVIGLPTAMLAWRQFTDYPSPKTVEEKQKPSEQSAQAPPVAAAPVPAAPTPAAPSPQAPSEKRVEPTPAPTAPALAVAAVPDSPPAAVARSPLDDLCPSKALPQNPESLTAFKDQVCAIVACAGESLTDDSALPIVLDWQTQTRIIERQSCLFADRTALTGASLFKSILAAVSQALDESSLPKDFELKNACRVMQDKLSATLMAARARLLPPDEMPRNCPPSGQNVSASVQEFMGRYQLR